MLLRRMVRATARPVMLVEAREHCKAPATEDDQVLLGLIAAACEMVGEMSGRVLAPETWAMSVPAACGDLVLPKAPVQDVTAITYYDQADALQVAALSDFYVFGDEDRCVIRPKAGRSWPVMMRRDDALTVTFVAGYENVPPALQKAALLLVGHLYENREATVTGVSSLPIPFGVTEMVGLFRRGWAAG